MAVTLVQGIYLNHFKLSSTLTILCFLGDQRVSKRPTDEE